MVSKRGWLKIVEAVIAVLLISGVLLFLFVKYEKQDNSENIIAMQKVILDEIAFDDELRRIVLDDANTDKNLLRDHIRERLPDNLGFEINVCEPGTICGLDNEEVSEKEVYTREALITTTLDSSIFRPRVLKLFVWNRQ